MSDNHRRYNAIKQGLLQFFEKAPTGRQAQYLNTLTQMISGLVGSRNAHLSSMAAKPEIQISPDSPQNYHISMVRKFISDTILVYWSW